MENGSIVPGEYPFSNSQDGLELGNTICKHMQRSVASALQAESCDTKG